uniref:Uncharacterized protein n=1 Tax=Picea sitchensis TaxID=3332 RepID=D5ACK1_PICSI|nr:unknown [Picea sitchensis]
MWVALGEENLPDCRHYLMTWNGECQCRAPVDVTVRSNCRHLIWQQNMVVI